MDRKDYSCVLLKDKKDLTQKFQNTFPWAKIAGCYDKLDEVDEHIRILSVKFSQVGLKTFRCYPNLRYIICRSHGIDNINKELCRKHDVEIIASYPTTRFVADYIIYHIKNIDAKSPYLYFGYGNIAKEVDKTLNSTKFIVNSKTPLQEIQSYLSAANTLIITSALCEKTCKVINSALLRYFISGNIISVARPDVLDNKDLLFYIREGNIKYLVADCLSTEYRDELLATGKVIFTHHTAWSFNFDENVYIAEVKRYIDEYLERIS